MKVYVAVEYTPYEGGDVENIFTDKEKAIEFVYSKLTGKDIKRHDYDKGDIMDRPTIFLESERFFDHWKIEEWEVRGTP